MIKQSMEILLPVHNEKGNIKIVVEKSLAWLKQHTKDYRVLIVDDGSDDGTKEVLNQLLKTETNIKVINHPTNLGIGKSLRTLYDNSNADFVFTCPGDGQFNTHEY